MSVISRKNLVNMMLRPLCGVSFVGSHKTRRCVGAQMDRPTNSPLVTPSLFGEIDKTRFVGANVTLAITILESPLHGLGANFLLG